MFNGAPPITNAQAGAIAAARLKIPTVAPGIGPSPELNRWKMAAVGYPLWLWADGPTHVGPVSDSVGGLSVSLEARVTKVTFRMGDGKTVNCAGHGQKWTRAVKPGAKSPSCGYSYTKPSLPEGSYTGCRHRQLGGDLDRQRRIRRDQCPGGRYRRSFPSVNCRCSFDSPLQDRQRHFIQFPRGFV